MEKLQRIQGKTNNWPTEDLPKSELGESQELHGWFSKKQKNSRIMLRDNALSKIPTVFIYLNEKGEEVEVTSATISARPAIKFDDIEYKGVLVKWKRTVY